VTGSDVYLLGLAASDGSVRWRRVLTGQSESNRDEAHFLDAANGAIFMTAVFDEYPEGGGGHLSLQRWDSAGQRVWRAPLPTFGVVSAQHNRSVLWSGTHYKNNRHTQLIVGLQRPGGAVGWRDRWSLPRGDSPASYAFDAAPHVGIGAAYLIKSPGGALQVWGWRWR
jgi:hypothetical protein